MFSKKLVTTSCGMSLFRVELNSKSPASSPYIDAPKEKKYRHYYIPTMIGQCLIADDYNKKEGIEVFILNFWEDGLLKACISKLRALDQVRVGFIVKACMNERTAHCTPLIYEKTVDSEAIIFLDSLGYGMLDDVRFTFLNADRLNAVLNQGEEKPIPVYANGGYGDPNCEYHIRQADHVSCVIDALVILKAALGSEKSIFSQLKNIHLIKEGYSFLYDNGTPSKKAITCATEHYSFSIPDAWTESVQSSHYLGEQGTQAGLSSLLLHERNRKKLQFNMFRWLEPDKNGIVEEKEIDAEGVYRKWSFYSQQESVRLHATVMNNINKMNKGSLRDDILTIVRSRVLTPSNFTGIDQLIGNCKKLAVSERSTVVTDKTCSASF